MLPKKDFIFKQDEKAEKIQRKKNTINAHQTKQEKRR